MNHSLLRADQHLSDNTIIGKTQENLSGTQQLKLIRILLQLKLTITLPSETGQQLEWSM